MRNKSFFHCQKGSTLDKNGQPRNGQFESVSLSDLHIVWDTLKDCYDRFKKKK